jgi:N-methylhydantoinase B
VIKDKETTPATPGNPADSIELELLRNRLEEIAEEMNAVLMRAAYSTNIADRRDSSSAVLLPDASVMAQSASGTPLHLGVLPGCVRTILRRFSVEQMHAGDGYWMNVPYPEGPGHLNDITLARPVFVDGRVVAIVANQAHHVDVGGSVPGSLAPTATEVFQEGFQIPPVALFRDGALVEDVAELFLTNIRTPSISRGDLLAQAAANHVGAERVTALYERETVESLRRRMDALLDASERRVREHIEYLPDGEYHAADTLDGPTGTVTIRVRLTIRGSSILADFAGTDPQVPGPINCRLPTLLACLAYVVVSLVDPGLSPNAGTLRALSVAAPEGTLVNARHPASTVQSNIVTTQRVCDVLLRALAVAAPEHVPAAGSGTQNLLAVGGFDAERGEPFTYMETHGGGSGAFPDRDGATAVHTHMTNTLNSPTEVIEQSFPLVIREYAIQPDSEGAGMHRGGFGMRKTVRFLAPAVATLAVERISTRPWGLEGGDAASPARVSISRDNRARELPGRTSIDILPGDELTLVTPGGGGFGEAVHRQRSDIERDVRNGLVSPERARRIYGLTNAHADLAE